MRRMLRVLAVLALVATGAAAAEAPIETAAPQPLPPLTFQTLDGQEATLADFAGKVVVLNLWATWCAPCREEMPGLDRLQAQFADRDVVVLALSVDRAGPERVKQFLDEIGVQAPARLSRPQGRGNPRAQGAGPAGDAPDRPPGPRGRPRPGHRPLGRASGGGRDREAAGRARGLGPTQRCGARLYMRRFRRWPARPGLRQVPPSLSLLVPSGQALLALASEHRGTCRHH